MNPIISPWWFYWIDILLSVKEGIMCTSTLIIGVYMFYTTIGNGNFYKSLKTSLIIMLISIGIVTIIPSKETMYTMLVAQNVTYENVEKAAGIIQDSVDYIFDKFNENK